MPVSHVESLLPISATGNACVTTRQSGCYIVDSASRLRRSFCMGRSLLILLLLARAASAACPATDGSCDCDANVAGTHVYLQTGDTQANLLKALGQKLRNNTAHPLTMIWVTNGSCTNIDQ